MAKAVVEFDVFHDSNADRSAPWVVIYRRNGGHWGRYQSSVCNEATAKAIASALTVALGDPEDPS